MLLDDHRRLIIICPLVELKIKIMNLIDNSIYQTIQYYNIICLYLISRYVFKNDNRGCTFWGTNCKFRGGRSKITASTNLVLQVKKGLLTMEPFPAVPTCLPLAYLEYRVTFVNSSCRRHHNVRFSVIKLSQTIIGTVTIVIIIAFRATSYVLENGNANNIDNSGQKYAMTSRVNFVKKHYLRYVGTHIFLLIFFFF